MEDNKTKIEMEFVDTEDEQEETKDLTEVKKTEEKPEAKNDGGLLGLFKNRR